MNRFFSSLVFFLIAFGASAQNYVYVYGNLIGAPSSQVNIEITVYSQPVVTATVTTTSEGIIPTTEIIYQSDSWDYIEASFVDCNGELYTTSFIPDSLPNLIDVNVSMFYCSNSIVYGCTDAAAVNYNPNATIDDGSCQYDECDGTEIYLDLQAENASEVSYSFYDANGYSVSGAVMALDSTQIITCLPDGCYFIYISNYSSPVSYQLHSDDEVIAFGNLGSGYDSLYVDIALNSDCGYIPGCDVLITTSAVEGLCGAYFNLFPANTNEIISWDFGDGISESTMDSIYHEYELDGIYVVCASYNTLECEMVNFCDTLLINNCQYIGVNYGCTDSLALNYNAGANYDDGTCEYPIPCDFNEMEFSITTEEWGYEISWQVLQDSIVYASGSGYSDYGTFGQTLCLPDGCYIFEMLDSYGDGWNGASFVIIYNGSQLASGTLEDGNLGGYGFGVNEIGCDDLVVYGCTDPDALNYNSAATLNNGTCTYITFPSNDLCINAVPLSDGINFVNNTYANANEGIFGQCWAFGQGEGEQTSVWYSFTTASIPASYHMEAIADGTNSLTDTQFGLFTECGGEMIYCDGNSGTGLFSRFDFECGDLAENTTYILVIDGYLGDAGTCYLEYTFTTDCDNQVYGCTDSSAVNYNPLATIDNGSCFYPPNDSCDISFNVIADSLGNDVFYIIPSVNTLEVDSVIWSFGDGTYSYDLFTTHEYDGDGPFELCLYATFFTDTSYCQSSYCAMLDGNLVGGTGLLEGSFTLNVLPPTITAVDEQLREKDIVLWPNPTAGLINLQLKTEIELNGTLSIFDIHGKELKRDILRNFNNGSNLQIDVSNFSPGIFLMMIQDGTRFTTKRFVVTK